jgi:addiction module RelB/DinJ family antitoxin
MKTTTSIKLDKNIKDQATALASELGLSLSSVINATLKKFVNERRVVLSISPEFNKKTEDRFLKMREDIKNNKNLSKTYTNSKELFKALEV